MTASQALLALALCFLCPGSSKLLAQKDASGKQPKDKTEDPKLAGTFHGRTGAIREAALRSGGGTKESEEAAAEGLRWLVRHQLVDGRWIMDNQGYPEKGTANDTAATAFGLLPLLANGSTHMSAKDHPYDRAVEKGLMALLRKQDKKNGYLGGGMYAHGMATIALCEAYGLSKDVNLLRPAQLAVSYIVNAQHDAGGWRYSPKQPGDTSVTGWQVMALKSAQMAGIAVPEDTMRKALKFLNGLGADDEGYGYTLPGSTLCPTAIGLLCRQHVEAWGPKNQRLIKGVDNHIKKNPPNIKNLYYSFHATQVMHHFGGDAWKEWNEKMREDLIKSQDTNNGPMKGSWSSQGDLQGAAGGRLMQTSMSILILQVYYRHLPLYYGRADNDK